MKKQHKLLVTFLTLLLVLAMFGLAGCGQKQTAEESMPPEVREVRDNVVTIAEEYALTLDGKWGDEHAAMMKSGKARDYDGYDKLLKTLKDMQEECGAYYVYTLVPTMDDDGQPLIEKDPFLVAVDASEDPDDWGTAYDWEIQFKEAYEGAPAAARSAWDNGAEELAWSAFAPIHDSKGNVVAILGIDYPAQEILDFPEWNRDSDSWNGFEE